MPDCSDALSGRIAQSPPMLGPGQVRTVLGPTTYTLWKPRRPLSASQHGWNCQCCLPEYLWYGQEGGIGCSGKSCGMTLLCDRPPTERVSFECTVGARHRLLYLVGKGQSSQAGSKAPFQRCCRSESHPWETASPSPTQGKSVQTGELPLAPFTAGITCRRRDSSFETRQSWDAGLGLLLCSVPPGDSIPPQGQVPSGTGVVKTS